MEDNTVNISEIIEALKVIKRECAKHSSCYDCCFYSQDKCNIKHVDPACWVFESQYIWRAFK